MKIRCGLIGIIIILLNLIVFVANTDGKEKMKYLQGYVKAILGGGFGYHSPHPDISKSLLVRHKSGENYIKWEAETVPQNYDGEYVSFIWYFGIDHRANENEFKLYINDVLNLTFNNKLGSEPGNWSVEGKNNTKLTFNATMIDKYSDLMGIATLQIPVTNLNKGEPVVLAVEGENAGKQSWYMTFEGKVEKKISLTQSDIIVKENYDHYLLLNLNIVHLEGKEDLEVKLNNRFVLKSTVQTGFNSYNLTTPKSLVGKEIAAEIKIGTEEPVIKRILLEEVREWFVNLVMHSHTDIGYTRPQTEILPEHLRYIDYALDFCDLTDNYPDDAKFRWTCESSWPLQEYLKSRPKSQIDRLGSRVSEGRIQLTAMMFNLSEMADEVLLAGMLKPVKQIRNAGLKIEYAMQNDINGIGWCFVDFFNGIGIKYLIMGEHGHRALIPFDYPTPFWWQSPSGEKILAYRTDHYMTGNMIGVHTGNLDLVKENLMNYLGKLRKTDYPYNDVHIQMSGYLTDNSPPSLIACDLVREWNEKYEWPKLRISTASEFIRKIEKEHSTNLPVIQAAWPDWWADGFGSAARETAESRRVQGEINSNCGLLSMVALLGADLPEDIEEEIYSIQQNLLFYAEHTFGYSESVREPMSEQTHVQWLEKASNIWEATKNSRMLTEKGMGFIQEYLPRYEVSSIAVFNTLNWSRSGLTEIYIDHQIIPEQENFKLVDLQGKEVFAQKLRSRSDGTYWGVWVDSIPPFGYKMYQIINRLDEHESEPQSSTAEILENNFYKIEVDAKSGTIKSIYDKESEIELVDQTAKYRLGEFIYERLSNRAQLERFRLEEEPKRSIAVDIKFIGRKNGPIWESMIFNGKIPNCADDKGVTFEIRLYHLSKKIDFLYNMTKLPVTDPEAVYVAFPFSLPNSKILFEAQGGIVEPGITQIPATSSDWNVIQNYASIENEFHNITFTSNEIPLVQFGDINIGRFEKEAKPKTTHIYSWVMNNYWVTNFRASQEGEFTWSYSITSGEKRNNSDQYKFGLGERTPFLSRVLPSGKKSNNKSFDSLIRLEYSNLIIISAKPINESNEILLQIKEVDGIETEFSLKDLELNRVKSIFESNLLGERISNSEVVKIKQYGSIFIKIIL